MIDSNSREQGRQALTKRRTSVLMGAIISITLLSIFLFNLSFISSYSIFNGGTLTGEYSIVKSGYEANADVTLTPIPEKIDTTFWQKILILLNIKEPEYKTVQLVSICYNQDKYVIDKTQVAVPITMPIYNKELILQKEVPVTLEKASTTSTKPTEYETGDKLCFYDKFDQTKDTYKKYGNNSIYIYTNTQSNSILNQTIWEASNSTHLEINNVTTNPPYDSLEGYWSFDTDSSTTAYDLSNNNNDGTYTNGALSNSSSGVYGNGAYSDGVNDYVVTTNIPTFVGRYRTISMWIKTNISANSAPLSISEFTDGDNKNEMSFYILSSGYPWVFVQRAGGSYEYAQYSTSITNNQWHYLVGIMNGSANRENLTIYIDGIESKSTSGGVGTTDGYNYDAVKTLTIGARNSHAGEFINAQIDEVMIFNTSLNSSQISQIYNNQSSRFKPSGTQTFAQKTIDMSSYDAINITMQISSNQNLLGSNVGARMGFWNLSYGYNDANDENYMNYLEAYFRADNSFNSTNGKYNGTAYNQANATSSGAYGKSFSFDGTADYINTTYTMPYLAGNTSSAFSTSFWVKNTKHGWNTVLGVANGSVSRYYFTWTLTGGLTWYFRDEISTTGNCYAATGNISDNRWHHIVGIKNYSANAGAWTLFLDGAIVNQQWYGTSCFQGFNDTWIPWFIGGINNNNAPLTGDQMRGSVDEIMFFNKSLNFSEVQSLYIKGRANWQYTNAVNLTQSETIIPVTSRATNILPELVLSAGFYNFYTPFFRVYNFSISEYTTPPIPPIITFNYQIPSDITTFNLFGNSLNISYNITDVDTTSVNLSTVNLFYKTNSSYNDNIYYTNGSATSGYQNITYLSNQSSTFLWQLFDNQIYPATYNFPERTMELTPHSAYSLANTLTTLTYMKIELLNVSNYTNYNFLEINLDNQTASSPSLSLYYCNSSLGIMDVMTSSNCYQQGNFLNTEYFNHSHSAYSSHRIKSIVINSTTGTIGTVKVTPTSYFVILNPVMGLGNGWNVYYINNISRTSAIQTSTTLGAMWTDFSGTVDAHLHQYTGNDTFYYYSCANDTANMQNCSTIRNDLLDLAGLPPTSPNVYSPTNQGYLINTNITINYTASVSPNNYAISLYNISLLNFPSLTFNITIINNNSNNLSYNWNVGLVGGFKIKVEACDILNQCSYGLSNNFSIVTDIIPPSLTINTPQNQTYNSTLVYLNGTCTDNVGIDITGYSLDGASFIYTPLNLIFSTVGYEVYHNLTVFCNDTSGNSVIVNRRFYIGNTASGGSINVTCSPNAIMTIYPNGTSACVNVTTKICLQHSFAYNYLNNFRYYQC